MPDPRALAARYGVAVELADLGGWGGTRLLGEYDPAGPVIRINRRTLPHGPPRAVSEHIARVIAHELYHHREAVGDVVRERGRAARERAADAFAAALLAR